MPIETFIRELKEETNYSVRQDKVIALREYLNKESNSWRYIFFIESDVEKEDLTLGEGAGFDWIKIESLDKLDLAEEVVPDLEFFKTLNNPHFLP